jgi:hypothetical protein
MIYHENSEKSPLDNFDKVYPLLDSADDLKLVFLVTDESKDCATIKSIVGVSVFQQDHALNRKWIFVSCLFLRIFH